jgi:hypothetical protein
MPKRHREPFHYLNNLRGFLARGEEGFQLAGWLAALGQDELDAFVDAVNDYMRVSGEMEEGLFADLLAVVIQILLIENQASSVTYSDEQLYQYFFALGMCGAFEQMRRADLVRILSPMRLTSDYAPEIELIQAH